MSMYEETQKVISSLSWLTTKEEALLHDEFRRLSYAHQNEKDIYEMLALFRELISSEQRYLETKSDVEKKRLEKDIKEAKEIINQMIDSVISHLKAVYRNVLDKDELKGVQKLIRKEEEMLKRHMLNEWHDYTGMHKIMAEASLFKGSNNVPAKGAEIQAEMERLVNMMRKIKKQIEEEHEIESLDGKVMEVLNRFRDLIEEQAKLLRAQFALLDDLRVDEKKLLLVKGQLPMRYGKARSALQENLVELRKNLIAEKKEVFDILNHFMKTRRTMESVFEHVFEETSREDLLGTKDVALLMSTVYSIDEAFDMIEVLFEYKDMFDADAQRMIKEKLKFLKKSMKSKAKQATLAYLDPLTGLPNNRAYYEKIEELQTTPNRIVSIVALDIDFFKAFNEVYGHRGGDRVLRSVAHTMRDNLRKGTDMICRKGGEEFVIILMDTDMEGAEKATEKLRKVIEQMDLPMFEVDNEAHRQEYFVNGKLRLIKDGKIMFYKDGLKWKAPRKDPENAVKADGEDFPITAKKGTKERAWITISFGIANYPQNSKDVTKLHDIADTACVEAKTKGRNMVILSKERAA